MDYFSERANTIINLAESFAAELNDKLAEYKGDAMNAQDLFNEAYDQGYKDGFFKGFELASKDYEESISILDDELEKMNGKLNEQIVMWSKEKQRADELQSLADDMNATIMQMLRSRMHKKTEF